MISIKHLVAAVALGTALVAAPAVSSAKVVPTKHTALTHKKASKLHKGLKSSHKALTSKHARGSKLSTSKKSSHKLSANWKHHHSI